MIGKSLLIFSLYLFSPLSNAGSKTPEELGQVWMEAIKNHRGNKIRAAIHPLCPKQAIYKRLISKMIAGEMPPQVRIRTSPLTDLSALNEMYLVLPELQLNLDYQSTTPEEKRKYGLGKGQPIAKHSGEWFFVMCLKRQIAD